MKLEFAEATKDHGPRYYLRPESAQEQRMLTIWRDWMLHTDNVLRVLGAEHSQKKLRGMPPKPVINMGLVMESREEKGSLPQGLDLKDQDVLDPTKPTSKEVLDSPSPVDRLVGGGGRRVQVIHQDTGSQGGPSTVIKED